MFKKGDLVKLKNGAATIKVNSTIGQYVYGNYVKSGKNISGYPNHFEYVSQTTETQEGTQKMNSTALYEVKVGETTKFANYLATNGKGDYVFEEKGSGDVFTAPKGSEQEVMPYTVDVKYSNGTNTYGYISKEGQFSKGDALVTPEGSFAMVVNVNTRNKSAIKEFVGSRLVTAPL